MDSFIILYIYIRFKALWWRSRWQEAENFSWTSITVVTVQINALWLAYRAFRFLQFHCRYWCRRATKGEQNLCGTWKSKLLDRKTKLLSVATQKEICSTTRRLSSNPNDAADFCRESACNDIMWQYKSQYKFIMIWWNNKMSHEAA